MLPGQTLPMNPPSTLSSDALPPPGTQPGFQQSPSAPRVSVIINVHNGDAYLESAISSILNQTFRNIELIVVDDGSTDRSAEIAQGQSDPRLRLVQTQVNLGIPKSINLGIAQARGEFIAHQDADDTSHPTRLARQVQFMDSHPEVAGIGSRYAHLTANGSTIRFWPGEPAFPTTALAIRWAMIFNRGLVHSSILFRRAIGWNELNGYDEHFPRAQDYEFWSRLAQKHVVVNLPENLVNLRHHRASNTRSNPIPQEALARLLSRSLKQTLDTDAVPGDEWVRQYVLLSSPDGRVDPGSAIDLYLGLLRIHARFGQVYPESIHEPEVAREVAYQFGHLASQMGRKNLRRESFRAFAEACRLNAAVASLVLPKYLAYLGAGNRAQNLWNRLAGT